MSLATYRRKRRFRRTPEPRGGAVRRRSSARPRTGLSYFIQKHAATRLHYDLRLELHGVLLSWAVPKGPCLDPRERRLAVHVEDHPLEYGTFEGEIPPGEYGGGTVQLWDRGRWTPRGDAEEGYAEGRLKFRLDGEKLRGGWTLVRMSGPSGEGGKNWLLIKENDEEAVPLARGDITELRPESVAGKKSRARASAVASRATAAKLPAFVEPQLAALAPRVPRGADWLHEIKFDGYRILATVNGGKATLRSRRGNDWTAQFRPAAESLGGLACRQAVLDGELVALDEKGRSDFQELQNAMKAGDPGRLVYYAFDLLFQDGYDLRGSPLIERKAALKKLIEESAAKNGQEFRARIRYSDHAAGEGESLYKKACEMRLEGIVSKRKDAPYRAGRSDTWAKIKCLQEQEFVVAGFTDPGGSRSSFGALVLGVNEDGRLRYAGRVGTGFTQASLRELHDKLLPLETRESPFPEPPAGADARGVHWVRPELVAEIAFSEWTRDGILRQPSFKGVREDKAAAEVTRERPAALPHAGRLSIAAAGGAVAGVKLTHPDRVLYPEQGITKQALAAYYVEIADRILPHLARRPLSLVRCPNGVGKPCFFQKHGKASFPDAHWVPIVERNGAREEYMYIEDEAGLISLVQAGVLEIHPWSSTVDDLERPDSMTFDLDPHPGTPWTRVLEAAREIRDRFAALKLETFVKTTGGKGLHVVVPLEPAAGWTDVKAFARAFAELMAADSPERYTAKLAKEARGGKIFVDYLRNERGQTAVAAYSTRARAGATVSTPLDWKELKPSLRSDQFNVLNLPKRLAKAGDPWKDFDKARRPLPFLR
ncbi:MAG TPA: DNA ligase D [Elusimicrobiota bacterium]|nr:DNA ligase D [Elusimicrobiota bacterium]